MSAQIASHQVRREWKAELIIAEEKSGKRGGRPESHNWSASSICERGFPRSVRRQMPRPSYLLPVPTMREPLVPVPALTPLLTLRPRATFWLWLTASRSALTFDLTFMFVLLL